MKKQKNLNDEISKAKTLMSIAKKMMAKGFFVNIIPLKNIVCNIYDTLNESEADEWKKMQPVMEKLTAEMNNFAQEFNEKDYYGDKL